MQLFVKEFLSAKRKRQRFLPSLQKPETFFYRHLVSDSFDLKIAHGFTVRVCWKSSNNSNTD